MSFAQLPFSVLLVNMGHSWLEDLHFCTIVQKTVFMSPMLFLDNQYFCA